MKTKNEKIAKAARRLVRFMKDHGAEELKLYDDGSYDMYSRLTPPPPDQAMDGPEPFRIYLDRVCGCEE